MNPAARNSRGSGKPGSDEMLTAPALDRPLDTEAHVSKGPSWEVQHNPTNRTGRDDGTRVAALQDKDGFEADDSNVAGTWHDAGNPAEASPVQRIRPEINGQHERGYVWQEPGFNPTTDVITDTGGGTIHPA